jgi:hypothetical protein
MILEDISMTKTPALSLRSFSIVPIGVGFAVVLAAIPALAAPVGMTSKCTVFNPNRFQCNFPELAKKTLTIQYASMQCGTTGGPFSLQQFQVLATPPNSNTEMAYQIPISIQPSVGGVVNAGSPVTLYAKAGFPPRALIDLTPAPANPGTECTVSLSGNE